MKSIFAGAILVGLTACASNPQHQAQLAEFEASRPTCDGQEQCDAMWERAQVWVAQNSRLKIQTATNVLIETYGGRQHDTTLSMRVLKEPMGGGKYRIVFSGGCNNMFGCSPTTAEAGIVFNAYVNAASEE